MEASGELVEEKRITPGGRDAFAAEHRDGHVTDNCRRERDAMRLTLKTVNGELAKLGYSARLEKGDGYFYFHFGEAADWLDRTVRVRNLNSLTLKQWVAEFHRLKALNEQIMRTVQPGHPAGREAGAATRTAGRKRRTSRSR